MESFHLKLAHFYFSKVLKKNDNSIDATCGNGYDCLFLSKITNGKIFCFDIQKKAIENTFNLLKKNSRINNIFFINNSHENFSFIYDPIKLIVYNLGYLPKSDKKITTQTPTTLKSIANGLKILTKNGYMSITCYPGHLEGYKEQRAIFEMLDKLNPKHFHFVRHLWINRDKAPCLILIKKLL